jgi:hypothetical protein
MREKNAWKNVIRYISFFTQLSYNEAIMVRATLQYPLFKYFLIPISLASCHMAKHQASSKTLAVSQDITLTGAACGDTYHIEWQVSNDLLKTIRTAALYRSSTNLECIELDLVKYPVTLMTMLLFTILALLFCTGKAACAESDASPRYRDKVEITSFTYGSLTPYWKISGLGREGDSSAASDRLAVTEGATVKVYSLKTKEKIFSRSYQESEAAGEGSYPQPSLPCHLSPDGKRLAILLRKAQRVEVIDISTGAIERSAIPAPS